MGLHVKKVLGYGITDLQVDGWKTDDPRVDWEQFNANRDLWNGLTVKDLVEWLRIPTIKERVLGWIREEEPTGPGEHLTYNLLVSFLERYAKHSVHPGSVMESIHWCPEYGIPGVMVLRCPDHDDWFRVRDIIDHYEEQDINGPKERVQLLEGNGIYPYTKGFVRFRDVPPDLVEQVEAVGSLVSSRCKGVAGGFLSGRDYNLLVGKWSPKLDSLATGRLLEHLQQDWRPSLPISLVVMMEYLGCFPGRAMRDCLRPMIYTYWS